MTIFYFLLQLIPNNPERTVEKPIVDWSDARLSVWPSFKDAASLIVTPMGIGKYLRRGFLNAYTAWIPNTAPLLLIAAELIQFDIRRAKQASDPSFSSKAQTYHGFGFPPGLTFMWLSFVLVLWLGVSIYTSIYLVILVSMYINL